MPPSNLPALPGVLQYLGPADEAQRVLQGSGIFDAPIEWLPGSFNLTESSWLEAAASLSGGE